MNNYPLQQRHLDHIRRHLALIIARIEDSCTKASDVGTRNDLEHTSAFAHDLLDKVSLAEQALSGQGDLAEVMARLDERYNESQARIDAMHDRLEQVKRPQRPDPHPHEKSSGSAIGDAVRDGFLNMG